MLVADGLLPGSHVHAQSNCLVKASWLASLAPPGRLAPGYGLYRGQLPPTVSRPPPTVASGYGLSASLAMRRFAMGPAHMSVEHKKKLIEQVHAGTLDQELHNASLL